MSPALLKKTRVSGRLAGDGLSGLDEVDIVLLLEADRWCSLNLSSCVSGIEYSEVRLTRLGNEKLSSPS